MRAASFAFAAACILLAGCATGTPAYVELQDAIQSGIVKKDQRPVGSVACNPHVDEVHYSDGIVELSCLVHFKDGSSYTTSATIEARSLQAAGYNFEWDDPGPLDITTAPLPQPSLSVPATSAKSLFYARNLSPVAKALAARFPANELILSMALYPGELVAVVGASGSARLVTAHASGALTVGPQTSFEGERTGIAISQLNPAVPERLARQIAVREGVPTNGLARFVLAFHGEDADWQIYPTAGQVHFQAHIMGDALQRIG